MTMISKNTLFILIVCIMVSTITNATNQVTSSFLLNRYQKSYTAGISTSLLANKGANEEAITFYNLGIMNLHNNISEALKFFHKAANIGFVEAEFNIAGYYSSLSDNRTNKSKAIEWYTKAAEKNYVPAQYNLAVLLGSHDESEKNKELALKWYQMAAHSGYAPAQSNLGVLFAIGEGVKKDLKTAVDWFSRSAEQDHVLALYNLGVAYEEKAKLAKSAIYEVYAVRWYKRAALKGNVKSMLNLGIMLSSAIGANKNLKEAHMWVNIALGIKCKKDRLVCRWSKKMFEGPASPIINNLWDLRIEIERQLKPRQIKDAHILAKKLIKENQFIREQIN